MLTVLCAALLGQLTPVPLSDGGPLRLDDLRVAPDGRFVIPEAELGDVRLSKGAPGQTDTRLPVGAPGPHNVGSAVAQDGLVAAVDRATNTLWVLPITGTEKPISQTLAGRPDYVRIFGGEIWVTEPEKQQIELLTLTRKPLAVQSIGALPVPAGPEALELDPQSGIAYTFSDSRLFGFDPIKHVRVSDAPIPCRGKPKGLALSGDGLAFVGCADGAALTLSLKDGKEVGRVAMGAGVDIIAFDKSTRRLYVPAGTAATLTIASVNTTGSLSKIRELPSAAHSHCVAVSNGIVLVCDPPNGRLLRLDDK